MESKVVTYKNIMLGALVIAAVLIAMPAMHVEFMGQKMSISFMQVEELSVIPKITWGASVISALYLLVHIHKDSNGMAGENICFLGCIVGGIELLSVVLMIACREAISRNAGLNAMMDWLNIKYSLTWSQYLLVVSAITIIVCSVFLMKWAKGKCPFVSEEEQESRCKRCIRCSKKTK